MRIYSLVFLVFFASGLMADVYRSVDENGNVVFTDQPSPDAELIEVDELQTIQPPPAGKFEYTPKPAKPQPRYTALDIVSPEHDSAIRDNGGNVTVNIRTNPALQGADKLVLYLDGEEIILGNATTKSFSGLDRGTHQLRAAIKDENDRIQLSSNSVTFHLLRHSVK